MNFLLVYGLVVAGVALWIWGFVAFTNWTYRFFLYRDDWFSISRASIIIYIFFTGLLVALVGVLT